MAEYFFMYYQSNYWDMEIVSSWAWTVQLYAFGDTLIVE